jgi:hypothetical protein
LEKYSASVGMALLEGWMEQATEHRRSSQLQGDQTEHEPVGMAGHGKGNNSKTKNLKEINVKVERP